MRIVLRAALAAALLVSALRAEEPADEPIVLTLHTAATASGAQVTVGDVATLQGGDANRRERIAHLDLTELPLTSEPILVSQQQIDFRLRIAGVDDGVFRMEGPRFVRVSRPAAEALDNKVEAVARQALQQKLTVAAEDVSIQLNQPIQLPSLSAEGGDVHLDAELRSPVPVPGRVMIEVGIYVRGARRASVPVYLDVKKLQAAPVALRRIEAGEEFGAGNVRVERVPVDNNRPAAVEAAGLTGRHAKRPIAAGRLIEPDDVESPTQAAVVIRSRDLVHIVAKLGPLQVRARGEALQEGRVGQMIQVRNVDSNTTVAGRVLDRSTVEVDY